MTAANPAYVIVQVGPTLTDANRSLYIDEYGDYYFGIRSAPGDPAFVQLSESHFNMHIYWVNEQRAGDTVPRANNTTHPDRLYAIEPTLPGITFDALLAEYGLTRNTLQNGLYFLSREGYAAPGRHALQLISAVDFRDIPDKNYTLSVVGVEIPEATPDSPYAYITAGDQDIAPAMPTLRARLNDGADGLIAGSVNWSMNIQYQRGRVQQVGGIHNFYNQPTWLQQLLTPPAGVTFAWGGDSDDPPRARHRAPDSDTYSRPAALAVTEEWSVLQNVPADVRRGGTATISYTYTPREGVTLTGKRVIHIRGTNPDQAAAIAYTESHDVRDVYEHWYARYVLGAESSYHQFNPVGANYRLDLGPNFTNLHGGDCPNFGYPNGWGLVQRDGTGAAGDPEATPQQLWDWQANIDCGVDELEEKRTDFAIPNLEFIRIRDGAPDAMPDDIVLNGVDFSRNNIWGHTPDQLQTIHFYNGYGYWTEYDSEVHRWIHRAETHDDYEPCRTRCYVLRVTDRMNANEVNPH